MRFIKFLLDPRGRLSRRQFWYAWLVILVLGIGVSQAKEQAGTLLGSVIGIYLTISVYGKRLHDLDKSAWKLCWPFTLTAASLVSSAVATYYFFSNPFGFNSNFQSIYLVVSCLSFAPIIIWIWYTLVVGFPQGLRGDNQFGPSPLDQTTISVKPGAQ